MNMDEIRNLVVGFVLVALIAASGAIALSAFRDSSSVTSGGYAYNISNNGLEGIDNTTAYFGTAGTIAGVSLLLFIVIGAFMFMSKRQ